jgi:putative transposase
MAKLFNAFLLMLAGATEKELILQVQYLKAENQILRGKLPGRITVTVAERTRLVELGRLIGSAIKDLITIVSPRTFARWVAADKKGATLAKRGRPRTPEETCEIVLRLARENDWGFTRLWGELKKLGIKIGKTTLRSILKENGIDPGPKRLTGGTWDQFVKRHAATLWQCDFVSKKVLSLKGRFDCYLLFFIHVESRRVWASPTTAHPTGAWVAQQARNFCMWAADQGLPLEYVTRDRDTKFQGMFNRIIEAEGAKVLRLPARAPNLNAFAERWVQSLQNECLDHFIVLGESHLDHLVSEYVAHYDEERPHQSKDNLPLTGNWSAPPSDGAIECRERLGGLLKHYHRRAA